jgi:arylsulfatase
MFFRCLPFLFLAILSAEAAPNVVLIIADDLGYGDVGCYRETGVQGPYETPRIDELASSGLRLTDFYQADSTSSASRAAMLTGCYPGRIGITGDFDPGEAAAERGKGLNRQEVTIAEALKQEGYATAFFGTWHLGIETKFLPRAQGFDQFFGLPYPHGVGDLSELPLIDGREVIETGPDIRQLTLRYTQHAKQFIWAQAAAEKPFFLCVSHAMPRSPLFVSKKFSGSAEYGLFGDVMRELDWSVGQIVEALREAGMEKKTLIIFTSDHGPDRSVEIGGKSDPFVGGAGTRSEGGQRVPCILSYPGKIEAGRVSAELAAGIDFLPTIAAIAGAELIAERKIDGVNLWPWLSGEAEKSPRRGFFYSPWVAREGEWKYYMPGQYEEYEGTQIVERTYANSRVFFLPQDPREIRSLHESQSEFAVSMAAKCRAFQAELEKEKRPVGWE